VSVDVHILGLLDLKLQLVQARKLNLLEHVPLRANLDRGITDTLVAIKVSPVAVATATAALATLLLTGATESSAVATQALELTALLTLLTESATATTLA